MSVYILLSRGFYCWGKPDPDLFKVKCPAVCRPTIFLSVCVYMYIYQPTNTYPCTPIHTYIYNTHQ